MKKVIQIGDNIIIISDYEGEELQSHRKTIRNILATSDTINGDLYEYDKEYVDNQKIVGGWALVNVLEDMQNIAYDELQSYFLQQFEVSHLALDMLGVIEELDEDKARNFIIGKFNNEFSEIEIAKVLYQID